MRTVYDVAEASGLFAANDIKVRIRPYEHYMLGEGKTSFLHVFGNIIEGRTTEQKAALSKNIIEQLCRLLPEVSFVSMNIRDFEKSTYSNKALIDPMNNSGDRHFGL